MSNIVALPTINPVAMSKAKTPVFVAPVRADTDNMPEMRLDDLPQNMFWQVLGRALTMRRQYGSGTEAAYVAWLANRLPVTMIDGAGNLHVDTRTSPAHRTMFTSHTDSVHSSGGINKVHVDGDFWRAGKGAALGADDGAGNAIMAYMIERGVPGYYVFFRGEECGGIGSKWLAEEMPSMFKEFDHAIAFDRADYYDVITHQGGTRCCSENFAMALAAELSTADSWCMPCDGGVYTDTAEFIELVPECTNISVGYKHQHGDREQQDIPFLWALAQRAVLINWGELPAERDPKKYESLYGGRSYGGVYLGGRSLNDDDYDYWDDADPVGARPAPVTEYKGAEAKLLLLLEEAVDHNILGKLMTEISEHICPESPSTAYNQMRLSLLDDDVLLTALDMLESGWMAAQIMDEIYDSCSVV